MTTEIMDKRLLNYPLSSLVIWLFHIEKFLSVKRKSPGQQVSHVNVSKREKQLSVCSFDIVCYCHSYQVKLLIWRGPLDRRWNVGGAERNGESYYRFTQTLLKARSHSPRLITQPAAYVFSSNSIHYVVQIKK